VAQESKGPKPKVFNLQINRKPYDWPQPLISGAEIKRLAGSPPDYVVNQLIDGPGEDPEIADDRRVDLSEKGIEKFLTRKPKTTPGA
jgi:hypothetical protein